MSRVAAIDCGTNSIRLLVADVDAGSLTDVVREIRVVRLGQDVDRTARFAPQALARTRAALHDYAATIAAHRATQVRMVATSAARDVDNRSEFESMVRAELGVTPDVITGDEEAELSFLGATGALPATDGPLLVADLGGGSTELVLGDGSVLGARADGALRACSMDVGCVRMTERHLHDDPPTTDQICAVVADTRAAIGAARADIPLDSGASLIGVAGTVTTIAALALHLPAYDAAAIHGASVAYRQVCAVTDRLLAMSREDRAALPVMHPGRVDVIVAGALILRTLMDEVDAGALVASEHDILDGVALRLADRPAETA